ncbi:hypothetical protein BDV98DRAFT_584192 [Pterulicium gracile]|uniref:Uncharacterized protein n=1 Tax=Pterulicium gracile TaxID=1884261 RepID=A0A5C3QBW8_9AGAR|nr:hypothetical protein BDV98DRAFT_584192 [Pterula gracilis]
MFKVSRSSDTASVQTHEGDPFVQIKDSTEDTTTIVSQEEGVWKSNQEPEDFAADLLALNLARETSVSKFLSVIMYDLSVQYTEAALSGIPQREEHHAKRSESAASIHQYRGLERVQGMYGARKRIELARRKFWEELPGIFGLPGWNEHLSPEELSALTVAAGSYAI